MHKQIVQSLPGKILAFLAIALFTGLAVVGIHSAIASDDGGATQIIGWVEDSKITGVDYTLKAKLDTGATTTSINAEVIEKPDEDVESGGIVKFYFVDADGNKTLFERPLTRWVKIKDGDRRPVVEMNLCVSGKWLKGEVNLSERDNFNYAVLVGRNLLKQGKFAVDSSQSFIAPATCETEDEA